MDKITPVLLAGGSGTRLWPISRKSNPKQFVSILNKNTLFQETAKRLKSSRKIAFNNPLIVTNSDFRFIILEQLKKLNINPSNIFLEPEPKNTAPAILVATYSLYVKNKNSIVLMTPTDHLIPEINKFRNLILSGVKRLEQGNLVVFGIKPTRPETGYGYIEISQGKNKNYHIKNFLEKPNISIANSIYKKNNYFWNAGLLLFKAKDLIEAFLKYYPKTFEFVKNSFEKGQKDLEFFRLDPLSWSKSENISVDYAILEKIKNLEAVPFYGKWSDLGDWKTVWQEHKKDKNGVAIQGNVTHYECKDSLLKTEIDGPQLVGIGLENLTAVAMKDAVLIANKNKSQDLKILVNKLKRKKLSVAEDFPKDYRPWGWFEVLSSSEFFKVKKIFVKPNSALSLQSHKYRSEHWIVVEGIARVTINKNMLTLKKGESTFISAGSIHRLQNPKKTSLIIIEVQTGTYFGEDDIIRYEDKYGRKNK